MADGTYNRGLLEIHDQDWEAADMRVLLLKQGGSLTFDRTDNFVADVLGHVGNTEADDGSYARQTVPSRSVTEDDTNHLLQIDHGDILFATLSGDEIGAIVYFRHVTDNTDSPVWFYKDSGFPFQPNGSDLEVRTGSNGLVRIADAP